MKEARKLAGGGVRLAMPHAFPDETPSAAPSAKPKRRRKASHVAAPAMPAAVDAPFEVARVWIFLPSTLGRLRYALARKAKLIVSLERDSLVITEVLK